jgi:hypothetical protein
MNKEQVVVQIFFMPWGADYFEKLATDYWPLNLGARR